MIKLFEYLEKKLFASQKHNGTATVLQLIPEKQFSIQKQQHLFKISTQKLFCYRN